MNTLTLIDDQAILKDQPDIEWSAANVAELQAMIENAKLEARRHSGAFARVRLILLGRILGYMTCGEVVSMRYKEAKTSLLRTIYNDVLIMPRDAYHLQAIAMEWELIRNWIGGNCSTSLPHPRTNG